MLQTYSRKPVRMLTEIMLLVLMCWAVPIPVGHNHSDLSLRVSEQQMACHLKCHHGGFENSDRWPTDFHWHWVFPMDGHEGLGGAELAVQADQIAPGQRLELPGPACILRLECVSLKQFFARPSLPASRQHSFQNVALLHSRQSLPELLGVVRC